MPQYGFQAIDADGHTIHGEVEALSKPEARSKLRKQGLAILSVNEHYDTKKTPIGKTIYQFSATKEGQQTETTGTITASTRQEAYKTLVYEYHLKPQYIIDTTTPEQTQQTQQQEGIPSAWAVPIKENHIKTVTQTKEKKRLQYLLDGIETLILPLLNTYESLLSGVAKRSIQDQLDTLVRLKFSSATEHVIELAERLLRQLSTGDIFQKTADIAEKSKAHEDLLQVTKELLTNPDSLGVRLKKIAQKYDIKQLRYYWQHTHFLSVLLKWIKQWSATIIIVLGGYALVHALWYWLSPNSLVYFRLYSMHLWIGILIVLFIFIISATLQRLQNPFWRIGLLVFLCFIPVIITILLPIISPIALF